MINFLINKLTDGIINFIKSSVFNDFNEDDKKLCVKKYNFINILLFAFVICNITILGSFYTLLNKNFIPLFDILLLFNCQLNSKNMMNNIHLIYNVFKIDVQFTIDDF
jgi:hypothetical protein